MPADQSQFSRLPKKQLVFIAEKLVDEDFPIGNPYDSDFENAYSTLQTVSGYFSVEATQEDVEFFSKFLEINDEIIADLFSNNREQMKNKELIEQLVIPLPKTYKLFYTVWGNCTYTEYLSQEFDSYDESWVEGSAEQQRQDGNWDFYNGDTVREPEYENFEESDHTFDFVKEVVNENSSIKSKKSFLGKIVLENTSEVINSLDKKTLLELKSMIDSKLRLL